ncbi:hypothetical protein VTK26DRAFT_9402 [Humicola hyalothermophila]
MIELDLPVHSLQGVDWQFYVAGNDCIQSSKSLTACQKRHVGPGTWLWTGRWLTSVRLLSIEVCTQTSASDERCT